MPHKTKLILHTTPSPVMYSVATPRVNPIISEGEPTIVFYWKICAGQTHSYYHFYPPTVLPVTIVTSLSSSTPNSSSQLMHSLLEPSLHLSLSFKMIVLFLYLLYS